MATSFTIPLRYPSRRTFTVVVPTASIGSGTGPSSGAFRSARGNPSG